MQLRAITHTTPFKMLSALTALMWFVGVLDVLASQAASVTPATTCAQILVPNNKSAPVNKKNARALLEDGIFSRFERKLLTEEESKARAQAPKMEAGQLKPIPKNHGTFLRRTTKSKEILGKWWGLHGLLLQSCGGICCPAWICTGLNHNKPLRKVILNCKQPPKSQHVVSLWLPVKLQRSMDLWLSIS